MKKILVLILALILLLSSCLTKEVNNAEDTHIEEANLVIASNDTTIQPYRNFRNSTTYTGDGWLHADGMGAFFILPEISGELPIVVYDESLELLVTGPGELFRVDVFDVELNRTHHHIEVDTFFELCEKLESGTYYVSVVVAYKGKFIETEEQYNSYADEYIFRMDVEEEIEDIGKNPTDEQVIEYFCKMLSDFKSEIPEEINAGRNYLCTEQYKVDNFDTFFEVNGYKEVSIDAQGFNDLITDINLCFEGDLMSNINVADNSTVKNATIIIEAYYGEQMIEVSADDTFLYLKAYISDDYYTIRISENAVHKCFLELIDNKACVFDFALEYDVEYIELHYVKDEAMKNYPENGQLSKLKIKDAKIITKIVQAIKETSLPINTYPSREHSDLILHTTDGDIYIKMKSPLSDDIEVLAEPTIIINGYFWYECHQLYEVLREFLG